MIGLPINLIGTKDNWTSAFSNHIAYLFFKFGFLLANDVIIFNEDEFLLDFTNTESFDDFHKLIILFNTPLILQINFDHLIVQLTRNKSNHLFLVVKVAIGLNNQRFVIVAIINQIGVFILYLDKNIMFVDELINPVVYLLVVILVSRTDNIVWLFKFILIAG